jgi:hypothetical protein
MGLGRRVVIGQWAPEPGPRWNPIPQIKSNQIIINSRIRRVLPIISPHHASGGGRALIGGRVQRGESPLPIMSISIAAAYGWVVLGGGETGSGYCVVVPGGDCER